MMWDSLRLSLMVILLLSALLLMLAKLVTTLVVYSDDPTTGIALRYPSLRENRVVLSGDQSGLAWIAGPDESFLGERFYNWLMAWDSQLILIFSGVGLLLGIAPLLRGRPAK